MKQIVDKLNDISVAMGGNRSDTNLIVDALDEIKSVAWQGGGNVDNVTPEMFGAVGDGVADDTTNLQTAIYYAYTKKIKLCLLNKTYLVSSPLIIHSELEIDGNNATIKTDKNISIIYSPDVVHNVNIHDLTLQGANNIVFTNNIGINLVAYYSKFSNLKILNCYTSMYMDTTGATGTLVENSYENITLYNYCQYGLFIGSANNGKLTDGNIDNIICNGNTNSTESDIYALYIGSGAGYSIDGVHIYGKNTHGILVANSFYSNISNIYIENFTKYGIYLPSTQIGCNVNNVLIKHDKVGTTGTAIYATMGGYLPYATHAGNISNVNIGRGSVTTGKSIVIESTSNCFNCTNIVIDGTSRTIENDCTNINYTYQGIRVLNDYTLTKNNGGTINSRIKTYKQFVAITHATTSLAITIPELVDNQKVCLELTGVGGKWTYQSGLFYKGFIYIVKNGSTYYARINNYLDTLFTVAPTVSNSVTNEITLNFEVADSTYFDLFYDMYVE